jgi:hypothetical protein
MKVQVKEVKTKIISIELSVDEAQNLTEDLTLAINKILGRITTDRHLRLVTFRNQIDNQLINIRDM